VLEPSASPGPTLSRREHRRLQTVEDILTTAVEQVQRGGASALSINGIAKSMRMSGAGLYRYFDSRESLLAAVIARGYTDLAAALQEAGGTANGGSPAERLTALAHRYRAWALANPYLFETLFSVRPPEYLGDLSHGVEALRGVMHTMITLYRDAIEDYTRHEPSATTANRRLSGDAPPSGGASQQLGTRDGDEFPAAVQRLAFWTWTRIHGVVDLEIAGMLADMNLDGEVLVQDEVTCLLGEARALSREDQNS
jgi:AcrR family transcriptional regulator